MVSPRTFQPSPQRSKIALIRLGMERGGAIQPTWLADNCGSVRPVQVDTRYKERLLITRHLGWQLRNHVESRESAGINSRLRFRLRGFNVATYG